MTNSVSKKGKLREAAGRDMVASKACRVGYPDTFLFPERRKRRLGNYS